MNITKSHVRDFVAHCSYFNSTKNCPFGLVNFDCTEKDDLSISDICVGKKITCKTEDLDCGNSGNTRIISRNACFNDFKYEHIQQWRNYIYDCFYSGVHFICLQDFPYRYITRLEQLGHLVYIAYAIGDNGDLIANAILINSNFLSQKEFKVCKVSYLPERSADNSDFISGTLLVYLEDKKLTIGSHYGYYATKVRSRAREMINRFSFMYDFHTTNKSDIIICGDFNPRTLSRWTNEAPLVNTGVKWFDTFCYYAKLVLFIMFTLVKITPLQELKKYSRFGVVCPNESTMKDKSFGPFTLPASKLDWTVDAVQTLFSSSELTVQVCEGDNLSDHYPIQITAL